MESPQLFADSQEAIRSAASLIRTAKYLTAFTGAGISVESGIPPFRGEGGLWNKYDPRLIELDYFLRHPEVSWPILREIFYDHFGMAKPNKAHQVLARLETEGWPHEEGTRSDPGGAASGGPGPAASQEARGYPLVGAASGSAPTDHPAGPSGDRGYLKALITQNIDSVG
jgi:hypothetical protein